MKKEVAVVVEDVLAMVAGVHHGRCATALLQHVGNLAQYVVGIEDGIVVGVYQILAVLGLGLVADVGLEEGKFPRVALSVAEVGTIGVEHDE